MTKLGPIILSIFSHLTNPLVYNQHPVATIVNNYLFFCINACLTSVELLHSMLATPRYVMWMPSSPCMGSDAHAKPQGFDSLARLLPFGVLWNSSIYHFSINEDAFLSLSGFWILLPCIMHPSYLFHSAPLYLSSHCTLNLPAPTTFGCLHCS